jgi:hypothetical protein
MNHYVLKNSVATLQKLRDAHYSQLDAGALAELDDVLLQLNKLKESDAPNVSLGELAFRVLRIIDNTISLVTNLTDLFR